MSRFQLNAEQTEEVITAVHSYLKDKTLVLVRGIPGLGKSTLGRAMVQRFGGIQIENDMQFMVSGEYVFDPVKLEDAHMATQLEVRNLLTEDAPCVVVTNTFTREWEMAAYRQLAAKFGYRLIIVDLLLCVRENMQKANEYFNATQFLEFLCSANVHSVPADKIRSMYDRYERSDQVISVHDYSVEDQEGSVDNDLGGAMTLKHPRCEYKLMDTGYYLALDLAVPEGANNPHSGIYQHCIQASQQILQTFGVTCGYRMLRKLTIRNAKSHGMAYAMKQQEALTGQPCTNPHANARNAVKLAAGWTRYHVTLLSPTEYTQLKRDDSFGQFLMYLSEIDFAPLMQATAQTAFSGSTAVGLGLQRGAVTENAAFQLDALGTAAGLSASDYSTALYLLFDPTIPTLRAIADVRVQFGLCGAGTSVTSVPENRNLAAPAASEVAAVTTESTVSSVSATSEAWQPHITLAFTHNDIRADPAHPETCDKALGVQRFRELVATIPGASFGDGEAPPSAVTDLVADAPGPSLATMLLYTETQASFRADQFGFTVVDVKVRRGPMGDDATYRSHPFLQTYLPRGLVYLQHERTRVIYRGLFSLRKFYGKEGVEDDGIGIGASQLNFKLKKVLENTSTLLVMEKVNGRAASCRFFTYDGGLYVVVGTKLSHVVCRVDTEARRLVMPGGGTTPGEQGETLDTDRAGGEIDGGGEGEEEDGELSRRSATAVSAAADTGGEAEATGQGAVNLIVSNVTALQSNLRWERLNHFVRWLDGRTFNGEVLDPREMHLVVLDSHQWVSLCVTRFVAAECGLGASLGEGTVGAGAEGDGSEGAEGTEISSQSALQDMFRLAEYTHCIPAYDSVAMATESDVEGSDDGTSGTVSGGVAAPITTGAAATVSAAVLRRRQAQLAATTQAVVHARDSEGKVLYFLDPVGRVLELLKFKTWWYIWRRSCRELVSSLFSRFYSAANVSKGANKRMMEQDSAEAERIAGQIANFTKIRDQMLRARPESQTSAKFQEKLNSITTQLQQLKAQEDRRARQQRGEEATDYDVSATAEELCLRVQRRWPTKFSFFQAELGEDYASIVERVVEIAQQFVRWCQARFAAEKNEFHRQFREVYPLVWERFLRECEVSDVF